MGAPFTGPSPFADPSQVFGEVQPGEQQMPGDPNAMVGPPGQPPPTGEHEPDPIDPEGAILAAIEAGCEMCTGSTEVSSEDFMRFAQGVSFLAAAIKDLQPQPHPATPAVIQADQRQTQADQAHGREVAKMAMDQIQQAQQAAQPQPQQPPNRPGAAPPSARG